jgi:hypothetical protein
MVDVSLVPESAWHEARRRAEVIRPLVESAHRSRHLVRAAAVTLGLSERHTLRRPLSPPRAFRLTRPTAGYRELCGASVANYRNM